MSYVLSPIPVLHISPIRRSFIVCIKPISEALDNCPSFSSSTSHSDTTSLSPSSTSTPSNSPSLLQHIIPQDPTTHPRRVLDVGCGSGSWCINAASQWPNASFVGVDLVAIQPDPLALEKIAALKTAYKNRTLNLPQVRHFNPIFSSSEIVAKRLHRINPVPILSLRMTCRKSRHLQIQSIAGYSGFITTSCKNVCRFEKTSLIWYMFVGSPMVFLKTR